MEKFPVNAGHKQLDKKPEMFKVSIETMDGGSIPFMLPAINRESAMALLDVFRFAMKPKVRGYIIAHPNDEVIAGVPAGGYVEMMTQGTSLRGEAPEIKKPKKLPSWELTKMKPEKKDMSDAAVKQFTAEIIIDGAMEKFPVSALNKESMIALLVAATCDRLPRIAGWNLYDDAGIMLASVPAVQFIGELAEGTGLGKKPADPKSAGWSVVPAVAPTTQEFAKMIDKAKKEGRLPQ